MAAVMAVWPGAATSFGTAGALCGLDLPTSGPVHVTATKARRQKAGVVVPRGALPHDEVRWVRGIPVTTVPRTLLDLSATEGPLRLRRLAKDCEFKGLVSFAAIDAILERYPRRRGRRNLAELARGTHRRSGRTRSALEDLFSDFVEKRKLPPPERNVAVRAGGRTMEVDCVWRDARLALELDGRSAHAIEAAFELDRERDRALLAAGWKPMRATWRQVKSGAALERDIRAVLTNGA